MSIGTITADTAMKVQHVAGKVLGTIEESFIARLKCGDKFTFAGKTLELVRTHQMTALVKKTTGRGTVPQWNGGKSPLSTELAAAVRRKIEDALHGRYDDPELQAARPVLELQRQTSRLPAPDELLIELLHDRDGYHAILYGFEGRLVHEGIGALLAYRIAQLEPHSITTTHNDYGIELLSRKPLPGTEEEWRKILTTDRLLEDLLSCLNATQLARRRFRDIARVAGLIFQGYPGMPKAARHLQASSELFFDVFEQFDPQNLLLDQARREVLERELEARRMKQALGRLSEQKIVLVRPKRLTPMAFPIWADRLREAHVSSERWLDRVKRMVMDLEEAAEHDTTEQPPRKPQPRVGRRRASPAA
jgi:ATP-dependent Lhr-like helicase